MAEIPLYQRNQLPPGPVDQPSYPKIPYELADTGQTDKSGQIRFGQTLFDLSGNVMEKLIQARVGNEIHEFMGSADVIKETFRGKVEANPGASFEDMKLWQDQMMTDIKKLGQGSMLPQSKEYVNNWFAANEDTLKKKSDADIYVIASQHEYQRFRTQIDNYISTGDIQKIKDSYDRQSGSLIYPKNVQAEKDEAVAKAQIVFATNQITTEARQLTIVNKGNWEFAYRYIASAKNQQEFAEKYNIPLEAIKKITLDIKTMFDAEQELAKIELEKQRETDRVNLAKLYDVTDPNYVSILETSSLDQNEKDKRKEGWQTHLKNRLSGKENADDQILVDGLKQDSFKVYLGEKDRKKHIEEINDAFYTEHKLTPTTKDELLAKMDNPLSPAQASAVRSKVNETKQMIVASMGGGVSVNLATGEITGQFQITGEKGQQQLKDRLKWASMYDREITEWVLKNDGDVGKKFEEKASDLQARYTNANYEEIQVKIKAKEERLNKPLEKQYKSGDTRTINGKVYTFNGVDWD